MPTTKWCVQEGKLFVVRDDGTPKPFVIRGVCYAPTPIGQGPQDLLRSDNFAVWRRDLARLRAMGANAIRVYGVDDRNPNDDALPSGANAFLREAWNDGVQPIYVVLSSWIEPGTFAKPDCTANCTSDVVARYRRIATAYGEHPAVLGFTIGSEFNNPDKGDDINRAGYWDDFKSVIAAVRERVGGNKIITTGLIESYEFVRKALENDVVLDAWGIDIYQKAEDFGGTWTKYEAEFQGPPPPLIICEFGAPASLHTPLEEAVELPPGPGERSMDKLVDYVSSVWQTIAAHQVGGFVFEWTDEWWKQTENCVRPPPPARPNPNRCTPEFQDGGSKALSYFAGGSGFWDEEWFGLNAVERGTPNLLRARATYQRLSTLWMEAAKAEGINMSLTGTYRNTEADEVLTIQQANDQNGELRGELSITFQGAPVKMFVTGHYHWHAGRGPHTSIAFFGFNDDTPASIYEAWSGVTSRTGFTTLEVRGSRSVLNGNGGTELIPLSGYFVRQP